MSWRLTSPGWKRSSGRCLKPPVRSCRTPGVEIAHRLLVVGCIFRLTAVTGAHCLRGGI
jgi:hypothetical protein